MNKISVNGGITLVNCRFARYKETIPDSSVRGKQL
jgi:hypothetical protein